MTDATPQSKGGKARADKLSSIQRRSIATDAARARWGGSQELPQVQCSGVLHLGSFSLPCAVLDNGQRVLSDTGISHALFGSRSGASIRGRKASAEDGAPLPAFLSAKQLKPFIPNDLEAEPLVPIRYRDGRRLGLGYDPRVLRLACEIWLRARAAGKLVPMQMEKAQQAELLMRALADIALVALVDKATGYQEQRDKQELQRILSAYISPTLLPWTERFPIDFFKSMFRVWGWPWPADGENYKGPIGPRYAGKLIKQVIYNNLPPGVTSELELRNPANEKWQMKNRMPELLTKEFGNPHVEKLVAVIGTLFDISDSKEDFWKHYHRKFPKTGDQLELLKDDSSD